MPVALEQMPPEPILVTKAGGERVPFDVTKLRGDIELCAPGSLPNDGKVIHDLRKVG